MNKLYRLKWSITDNPDGWIEPTTFCQFKCSNCYRGISEKGHKGKHEDLAELKKQVDWFIDKRNVQTISIAGGEPLMYPQIEELIEYIHEKGLKSKIYTNAIGLDETKLVRFKEKGATEFVIHIDKDQRESNSEESINSIRQEYCNLFRKVKGVNLGFIMPISKENINDLPILAKFFQKNSDIVNLIVFTMMKEMLPNKSLDDNLKIEMNEVISKVKETFGISFGAYLGKELNDDLSWLFSLSLYKNGKLLGSFDDKMYEEIQNRYYQNKGKYFITIKNKPIGFLKLLPKFLNKSMMKILLKSIGYKGKSINAQVVLIIDPPDMIDGKWNLCKGCPDAMLYENKLVPSCLLERIKSKEKIFLN